MKQCIDGVCGPPFWEDLQELPSPGPSLASKSLDGCLYPLQVTMQPWPVSVAKLPALPVASAQAIPLPKTQPSYEARALQGSSDGSQVPNKGEYLKMVTKKKGTLGHKIEFPCQTFGNINKTQWYVFTPWSLKCKK